jgi:hypothetical protein
MSLLSYNGGIWQDEQQSRFDTVAEQFQFQETVM